MYVTLSKEASRVVIFPANFIPSPSCPVEFTLEYEELRSACVFVAVGQSLPIQSHRQSKR